MLQLNTQVVWQCRGQTVFVAYIQYHSDLQSCHIHSRHHACFLFMYINTSGPFTALVLAAQAEGKLCASFKQLWHLEGAPVVLQPFDPGRVWPESSGLAQSSGQTCWWWKKAEEERVKGSEQGEHCWWNSNVLCSRVSACWFSNIGQKTNVLWPHIQETCVWRTPLNTVKNLVNVVLSHTSLLNHKIT